MFCGELFGQMAQNAAAVSGNECLQELAAEYAGAMEDVAALATIASLRGIFKAPSQAAERLDRKLSALEKAQSSAAQARKLPDGRVRYYGAEKGSRSPGPTRGRSFVTEYDPATGRVRQWMETYDQSGAVNRVHPKMVNGEVLDVQHYPPTAGEFGP